jgi:hypothetical protein
VQKAYDRYAKALDRVADSEAKARQEAVRHNEVLKTSARDTEAVTRSAERLANAHRDAAAAMRSARGAAHPPRGTCRRTSTRETSSCGARPETRTHCPSAPNARRFGVL